MKIHITGNAGFIGSKVTAALRTQGETLMLTDSMERQVHGSNWGGVEGRWSRSGEYPAKAADIVIHLAAKVGVGQSMYEPANYVDCNSLDTARFLENLGPCKPKRLVVASSMSVYGEGYPDGGVTEYTPIDLRSVYALTKYDQEQLCLIWGKANGVDVVALRFFNVYGPGQALTNPYTGVLAIFATRLLNRKAPIIYGDGYQTRDFIHVDDIARAVVHAASGNMPPGIYNVGTGVPRTIESVAIALAEALGADIPPVITGQERAGDIRHCFADISKILNTGWKPEIAFEDGIRQYANWLLTQPVPEDRFDQAETELKKAGLLTAT